MKASISANCPEIQALVLSQLLLLHSTNASTIHIIAFAWEWDVRRDRANCHNIRPMIHTYTVCHPTVLTLTM